MVTLRKRYQSGTPLSEADQKTLAMLCTKFSPKAIAQHLGVSKSSLQRARNGEPIAFDHHALYADFIRDMREQEAAELKTLESKAQPQETPKTEPQKSDSSVWDVLYAAAASVGYELLGANLRRGAVALMCSASAERVFRD